MEKGINTIYFKYIIANFAKEFFKIQIEKFDIKNEFIRKTEVQDVDPLDIKVFKESDSYKLKIQMVESELKIWKDNHKDYYRMQPSLPSSSEYSKYCENITLNLTLNTAIDGYKSANEILKSISNEDLNPYCIELKPMLNYEHKIEYDEINNQLKTKYEVPSDDEIKSALTIKTITKKRLCLDRSKSTDSVAIDEFYIKFEEAFNFSNNAID